MVRLFLYASDMSRFLFVSSTFLCFLVAVPLVATEPIHLRGVSQTGGRSIGGGLSLNHVIGEPLAGTATTGSGLLRTGFAGYLLPFVTGSPTAVAFVAADAQVVGTKVSVRWEVIATTSATRFEIVRWTEDETPRVVARELAGDGASGEWRDDSVAPATTYTYQIVGSDRDGAYASIPLSVTTPDWVPALLPNHPNPFNPTTTIPFYLPMSAQVRLDVFDVNGRRVVRLVNETLAAGNHSVQWRGTTPSGSAASGIYFVKLRVGNQVLTRKMSLVK